MQLFDNIYIKMYSFPNKRKITVTGRNLCEKHYEITNSYSAVCVQLVGIYISYNYCDLFYHGSTALLGLGLLLIEVSRSRSGPAHSVRLLWPGERAVAETST